MIPFSKLPSQRVKIYMNYISRLKNKGLGLSVALITR